MKFASQPYRPDVTYWLIIGKEDGSYKYALLGRYIDGKFEFRNEEANPHYIFREEIHRD
jgi:hypothetical protein